MKLTNPFRKESKLKPEVLSELDIALGRAHAELTHAREILDELKDAEDACEEEQHSPHSN